MDGKSMGKTALAVAIVALLAAAPSSANEEDYEEIVPGTVKALGYALVVDTNATSVQRRAKSYKEALEESFQDHGVRAIDLGSASGIRSVRSLDGRPFLTFTVYAHEEVVGGTTVLVSYVDAEFGEEATCTRTKKLGPVCSGSHKSEVRVAGVSSSALIYLDAQVAGMIVLAARNAAR